MKKFEHKNKDERRRVLLSKNNELSYAFDNEKLPEGNEAVQANGVGVMAKLRNMNKRVLAVVLAIVMVAGLIPAGIMVLKTKAADNDYSLGPVTMNVRINGEDVEGTASVKAGQITPDSIRLNDVQLPDGAEFVKAILVDRFTKVETPIFAVGSKGSTNYYSINQDGFTGVEQTNEDILVLVYANKYKVEFSNADVDSTNTWTVNGFGTFKSNAIKDGDNYYIYGGDDLQIKEIKPFQDRSASIVTYITYEDGTAQNNGSVNIKNSTASVPADMYSGDTIRVNVNFNAISTYKVQDARYMSGSIYYLDYKGKENHGGLTSNTSAKGQTNSLPDIAYDADSTTFYVFSQKNTIGSEVWRLSMLSINGVDVQFPNNAGDANAVSTEIKNGKNVVVTYITENHQFTDDNSNSPRTLYKVVVPNLHENIEVNYYFTNIRKRQIIIKGLRGIEQTAYGAEDTNPMGHYYTFVQDEVYKNVYSAYYTAPVLSINVLPSDNLALYTVKPGYNPYSVVTEMYYDNVKADASMIRDTDIADTPVNVIKEAGSSYEAQGRYNTEFRYWGYSDDPELKNHGTKDYLKRDGIVINRTDLLLTTLSKRNEEWYAIALSQNTSTNQQLYLNAKPYPYALELDPNGGTFKGSQNAWIEDTIYTVESENNLFVPSEKPTREGYVFQGWRLEDSEGNTINEDDAFYHPSDRINLNASTINNAIGNKKDAANNTVQHITMKAEWKQSQTAFSTTVQVNAYKQEDIDTANDNAPIYSNNLIADNTETQIANIETALLNDKTGLSNDPHYVIASGTTEPYQTRQNETNVFNIFYDYRLEDLTVTNRVLGYPKTQLFPVTITFTPDNENPVVPLNQAANILNNGNVIVTADADNNKLVYKKNMAKDEELTLQVPYGWSYTISVANNPEDYSAAFDPDKTGTMDKAKEVEITIIDAESGVETDKHISGPDENGYYSLTMESWATKDNYLKPKKNATVTPLDIALVIDQSGSMLTADMGDNYEIAGENGAVGDDESRAKTEWTVKDVEEYGDTLFYRVGTGGNAKYYPVMLGEGTLYSEAAPATVKSIIGGGHDSMIDLNPLHELWGEGLGVKPHFNVPTAYYYPDNDNVMHKVFFITVGTDAHYCAHPYYYTNLGDSAESLSEWTSSKRFANISNADWTNGGQLFEERMTDSAMGPWPSIIKANGTNSNRVRLIPKSGYPGGVDFNSTNFGYRTIISSGGVGENHGNHYSYGFTYDSERVNGLYLPQVGTTYNYLYYVDDDGNKISLNNSPRSGEDLSSRVNLTADGDADYVVYTDDQTAYSSTVAGGGSLYVAKGITRLEALQNAVKTFTQVVANNAKQYNVNHRISLVGFAGSAVPYLSNNSNKYNASGYNDKWDYVNTGLFVPGARNKTGTRTGFKNYKSIEDFAAYNDTRFINSHYFIENNNYPESKNKTPVKYRNGKWQTLYSSADQSGNDFYSPSYQNLSVQDYQDSLMPVSKSVDGSFSGEVTDFIKDSIDKFGAYGGTYTSYGMTMANKVLDNATPNTWTEPNTGETISSKKIIIVFTDGEPGGSGYEEAIAGEALADGGSAKSKQYEVYTVGLYKTNPGDQINDFMSQLSSQYTASRQNVYGAANPSDSNNNGLGTGSNALDENETYYYSATDGKTYAVTSKHNGSSSLGWWVHYPNGYSADPVTPKSNDSSSSGAGTDIFYTKNGNRYSATEPETVNNNHNTVYYIKYSENGSTNYYPVYYEYRWYNSDGIIAIPKTSSSSTGVQFFKNNLTPNANAAKYYYRASNADELTNAFQFIANSVYSNTTVMHLGAENSMTRDVLSDNFEKNNATDVKIYSVEGEYVDDSANPGAKKLQWASERTEITNDVDWGWVKKDGKDAVEVKGFDYSGNWVHETRTEGKGKKLVIDITGLDPKKTGFHVESNIKETSGVYELLHEDDDMNKPLTGEEELLKDFPLPEVNRPEYSLVIDGEDKDAQYSAQLRLEDAEGNAVTEEQWVKFAEKNPELQELVFSNGKIVLWENEKADYTDSAILENVFQNLPDGYRVFATVTKTNDQPAVFEYSVKSGKTNNEVEKDFGAVNEFEITPNETRIIVTSKRKTKIVSIRKLTVATDPNNDFTNPNKPFEINVQLYDSPNHKFTDSVTYGDTVYDKGAVTLTLSNTQARAIEVPVDYYIDVKEVDKAEYEDDYYVAYNEYDSSSQDLQLGEFVGDEEAMLQVQSANAHMRITVKNSLDAPPVTGFFDSHNTNALIFALGGIAVLAGGAWLEIVAKRKRQMAEQ